MADPTGLQSIDMSDEKRRYVEHTLDPLLVPLVTALIDNMPEDPIQFMIDRLSKNVSSSSAAEENERLKKEVQQLQAHLQESSALIATNDEEESEEEDDDDDDVLDEIPEMPQNRSKARASVSAEAYGAWNTKKDFTPQVHSKTDAQRERLNDTLKAVFMFAALDESELKIVVDAMVEKNFAAEERAITKGDDGDFLFVIESGKLECKIDGTVVKVVEAGDVFGELSLLYNQPRAADVDAVEASVCWQLDRETFTHVVRDAASKKREKYESFLRSVPLLAALSPYELSQVCDALKPAAYEAGEKIITEGDQQGDDFFIIEEGTAFATKADKGDAHILDYSVGSYFGELSLLKSQPRAASVTSGDAGCKVLKLDRRSFKRLLGPLQDIMAAKASDTYK